MLLRGNQLHFMHCATWFVAVFSFSIVQLDERQRRMVSFAHTERFSTKQRDIL